MKLRLGFMESAESTLEVIKRLVQAGPLSTWRARYKNQKNCHFEIEQYSRVPEETWKSENSRPMTNLWVILGCFHSPLIISKYQCWGKPVTYMVLFRRFHHF